MQGKQFSVIVTEGRPDETGLTMARVLEEMRVPTTVILDSAAAYAMERWVGHGPVLSGSLRRSICALLALPRNARSPLALGRAGLQALPVQLGVAS